jgi:hypothetical protein
LRRTATTLVESPEHSLNDIGYWQIERVEGARERLDWLEGGGLAAIRDFILQHRDTI